MKVSLSVLSALLLLVSCGGEGKIEVEGVAPKLSVSTNPVTADAGSQFLSVTAKGSWNISVSGGTWLSVSPSSGSGNNAGVVLKYDKNPDTSQRSATLTLTSGSVSSNLTFTQSASSSQGGNPGGEQKTLSATVSTSDASSVGETSAVLSGSYGEANASIKEAGFMIGEHQDRLDTKVVFNGNLSGESGSFSSTCTSLSSGTTYYFKAYVVLSEGSSTKTFEGAVKSFTTTTPEMTVTVTTDIATDITLSTAKLTASYSDASAAVREVGFEWGLTSSLGQVQQSSSAISGSSGSFDATLTGLGDDKTYYYRAYVSLQSGDKIKTFYGAVKSFKTESSGSTTPSSGGWAELPVVNSKKSGDYLVDATDNTLYYAYHFCPGGEKNPSGKPLRNYTVCFSSKHHCPVWVAAPRHSCYEGSSGRTEAYGPDPDIPASYQYKSKSTGGGCNKGHMLGSAERTSTKETNRQVFYYSNIAPQLSSGFNTGGGGWNILEDWVDAQVCSDTLYQVIGTYFSTFTDGYGNKVEPDVISFGDRDDVDIPTMFYYVLLRTKSGNSRKAVQDCSADELKCVALVRSHTNKLKGQKVTSKEMMSVEDLEKIVGVKFFANVPNAPKSSFKASDWGL